MRRHADALGVARSLWDLGPFEAVQKSKVLADLVRLTELVCPGDFETLTTLYFHRLGKRGRDLARMGDDDDHFRCNQKKFEVRLPRARWTSLLISSP